MDLSRLKDEELLGMIRDGKHEAFAELVGRHSNKFYRLAYRLLFNREDAEDIVQDGFLKIWANPRLWKPGKGAKFTTWFYRVITNLCLDFKRAKRPVPLLDFPETHRRISSKEEHLDISDGQRVLDRLLQDLPARQQVALNLCFYEGLSNREASEIMGVSVKALESLLMRAKTTLKEKAGVHGRKRLCHEV